MAFREKFIRRLQTVRVPVGYRLDSAFADWLSSILERITGELEVPEMPEFPVYTHAANYATITHTGTVSATDLWTKAEALPAREYIRQGRSLRVRILGEYVGGAFGSLAGSVTISMVLAGTVIGSTVLTAGLSSRAFTAEFDVFCVADGNTQLVFGRTFASSLSNFTRAAAAVDLTSAPADFAVRVTLADASDTIKLDVIELLG